MKPRARIDSRALSLLAVISDAAAAGWLRLTLYAARHAPGGRVPRAVAIDAMRVARRPRRVVEAALAELAGAHLVTLDGDHVRLGELVHVASRSARRRTGPAS